VTARVVKPRTAAKASTAENDTIYWLRTDEWGKETPFFEPPPPPGHLTVMVIDQWTEETKTWRRKDDDGRLVARVPPGVVRTLFACAWRRDAYACPRLLIPTSLL
jgi:hypothetical protein